MRLRARFTALFAILSALAVVFLVLVSDATVRRDEFTVADNERVANAELSQGDVFLAIVALTRH